MTCPNPSGITLSCNICIQFPHTLIFCNTEGGGRGKELSAICIRRPNTGGGLFSGITAPSQTCCGIQSKKFLTRKDKLAAHKFNTIQLKKHLQYRLLPFTMKVTGYYRIRSSINTTYCP